MAQFCFLFVSQCSYSHVRSFFLFLNTFSKSKMEKYHLHELHSVHFLKSQPSQKKRIYIMYCGFFAKHYHPFHR